MEVTDLDELHFSGQPGSEGTGSVVLLVEPAGQETLQRLSGDQGVQGAPQPAPGAPLTIRYPGGACWRKPACGGLKKIQKQNRDVAGYEITRRHEGPRETLQREGTTYGWSSAPPCRRRTWCQWRGYYVNEGLYRDSLRGTYARAARLTLTGGSSPARCPQP